MIMKRLGMMITVRLHFVVVVVLASIVLRVIMDHLSFLLLLVSTISLL